MAPGPENLANFHSTPPVSDSVFFVKIDRVKELKRSLDDFRGLSAGEPSRASPISTITAFFSLKSLACFSPCKLPVINDILSEVLCVWGVERVVQINGDKFEIFRNLSPDFDAKKEAYMRGTWELSAAATIG